MKSGIICNRCNNIYQEPIKCGLPQCTYSEYFKDIRDRFGNNIPPKYYFSLIGGVNSGKTLYLMALIDILVINNKPVKSLLKKMGILKIEMVDRVSWDLFDQLSELYKLGQLFNTPPKTPLGSFNLIIELTNDKTYEIVLFNTSGEKIEDEFLARKVKTEAHEMKGGALLYFLDPREDSMLNKLLDLPKGDASRNYEMAEYVYNVMKTVNKGTMIINNPLAVCISKFDLLLHRIPHDLPEHPFIELHNRNFFRNIESTSKRIAAFLQEKSETIDPSEINQKFIKHCYFALAPFGKEIEPVFWHEREPKGMLSPFFWLLKELNIVKDEYGIK